MSADPETRFLAARDRHRSGDIDGAEKAYATILESCPNHAGAWHLLGVCALQRGQPQRAVEKISTAIAQDPNDAQAHNNLGVAYTAMQRHAEAERAFLDAVRLDSRSADALFNAASAALALNRKQDAEQGFLRTLDVAPDHVGAALNLAHVLLKRGRAEEALERLTPLQDEPTLNPADVTASVAEGYFQTGRLDEARRACDRVLDTVPGHMGARLNRSNVCLAEGDVDGALADLLAAEKSAPESPHVLYNLALLRLRRGQWQDGWRDHEDRVDAARIKAAQDAPVWRGEDMAGRHLLVVAEQGLGDSLQFIRFLPHLSDLNARITFQLHPPLHGLMSGYSDQMTLCGHDGPTDPVDAHIPLMSLPHWFGLHRDEDIAVDAPYLHVPEDAIAAWRQRVAGGTGLKIGINWRGNPDVSNDAMRSLPFDALAPLEGLSGVSLFGLHKGADDGRLAGHPTITDLGPDLNSFVDTAAAMKNLDLVITSDTSTAHLAGAIGVPTWVMLSRFCDWRWMDERDDCPWYPTVRLFRQKTLNNWRDVMDDMIQALQEKRT